MCRQPSKNIMLLFRPSAFLLLSISQHKTGTTMWMVHMELSYICTIIMATKFNFRLIWSEYQQEIGLFVARFSCLMITERVLNSVWTHGGRASLKWDVPFHHDEKCRLCTLYGQSWWERLSEPPLWQAQKCNIIGALIWEGFEIWDKRSFLHEWLVSPRHLAFMQTCRLQFFCINKSLSVP